MMASPAEIIQSRLARSCIPRERLNIWQWADKYRFLAKGVSAKSQHGHARYRSSDAPHQREPQEAFTDPDVQMTVMVMASQVGGKTEVFNNVLGYHMEYKPTNSVVMYPTIDSAEKYSKKKFSPMAAATPVLDCILSAPKSRNSANTILVKDFVGGSIFFVGANSPASLRQASGEVLLADEIDSYEGDAGGEGDPVDLFWKRGESFPSCVKGLASTPTVKGQSRIWSWFELSDQRYWYVPCVHCGHFHTLQWCNVQWEKDAPETARLICPQCRKDISDAQRLEMYYRGEWRPTAPFKGIRGYHLNWLYCPWPPQKGFNGRLHQFATEWTRATKKGSDNLKVLINTGLCECFEESTEKAPDTTGLMLRAEKYPEELPEPVVFLTCAVDTQAARLEYEVIGWAVGEESYGIESGKIFGNPHSEETWQKLDNDVLLRQFQHPSGVKLKIAACLIDSGGHSDNRAFTLPVYRFAKKRQGRFVFACKGSNDLNAPIVLSRFQKSGIMLQLVGTDVAKSTVYERLEVPSPGPLYCHFPEGRGYDDEWYQQLVSERIRMERSRGTVKRVWVKTRARNEALDIRAYNLAAFELRNPNLEIIAQNIKRQAEQLRRAPVAALPDGAPKPLDISHSSKQMPSKDGKPASPKRFRMRVGWSGLE